MPYLVVSLFPQRLILSRFGCFVIHDSLIATPTRHSLISGVVCTLGTRAAHKLGARAARKLGARAAGPQRFRHKTCLSVPANNYTARTMRHMTYLVRIYVDL